MKHVLALTLVLMVAKSAFAQDTGTGMAAREDAFLRANGAKAAALSPQTRPTTQPIAVADISVPIKTFLDGNEKHRLMDLKRLRLQLQSDTQSFQDAGAPYKSGWKDRMQAAKALVDEADKAKGHYIPPNVSFRVGEIGRFPSFDSFLIVQIVNENELLVSLGKTTMWLKGFNTAGHVDGEHVHPDGPIYFSGTKQYDTAAGATKTVLLAEPIDLDPYFAAVAQKPTTNPSH